MVFRNQVNQGYYLSYFNLDSAFTEYCDYITSSETIRTVCHIGDDFSLWREDGVKTVDMHEITFSFPKEDYSTITGIPAPQIGEKVTRLNPDTLASEETYRVDRIENQNRWLTTVTAVLDTVEKRGRNGDQ